MAARLAAHGGYTHELARYWSLEVLKQQPAILAALVRRYPYLLVDEAQDIGTLHQALIERLIAAGANVTLIGDPNQGIYEFMGATGQFLVDYGKRAGVATASLTTNYRSVPEILDRANALSERQDNPHRDAPDSHHGAYFTSYKDADEERLIAAFHTRIEAAALCASRSAVLCRAGADVRRLNGSDGAPGVGAVKLLAQAATLRDGKSDYNGAFKLVVGALMSLLDNPPSAWRRV
ncbi:UvrD-helicase domain-containing protein [Stenotrophomonas sp. CD2]|nr:UvrD-helicase domain-containing protein [Stenotrophomonas sp. CD2]